MSKGKKNLVTLVKMRIAEIEESPAIVKFSPAVLEAMRLADLFESVHSQEYILPLDVLAGFSIAKMS